MTTTPPVEDQARALAEDARFCEYLDAISSLPCGWPYSRYRARRWLEAQCGVESLGHLATDPEAAACFDQIARRFAVWDSNGELPL